MPSFSFPKREKGKDDHNIEIFIKDEDKSCRIDVSNGATHSLELSYGDVIHLISLLTMLYGAKESEETVRVKKDGF